MSKHQPKVWKKRLLEALERNLGIVTAACKEVGISRDRFYHYYNNDLEFKKAVDDIEEIQLDFVENQLFKKIQSGSERSILFYMKYKARSRGYKSSVDITSDDKSINVGPAEIKITFKDGSGNDINESFEGDVEDR